MRLGRPDSANGIALGMSGPMMVGEL